MRILLASIGTRGDMEPFLAIGEILANRGHQVSYAIPEQYVSLLSSGITVYPLSPWLVELIESEEGRTFVGQASLWAKFKAMVFMVREGININKEMTLQQYDFIEREDPDMIIHNAKCNYPVIWGLLHSRATVLVSPVPYLMYQVDGHPHVGVNKNLGTLLNKLTYTLSNYGLTQTIKSSQKALSIARKFSRRQVRDAVFDRKMIYTISPSLFERPDHWPEHVQVLGYHERNKIVDWNPDAPLLDFLEKHEKILFITFGSMVNTYPRETSAFVYKVLKELNIPAIINIAAGGLIRLDEYVDDELFHFVDRIPYDWILERVYCIVHHGGSGTTHTGLKYGCATMIIPHIMDQFAWNNRINELGAGPKGISINKLNSTKFKELVGKLYHDDSFKNRAIELSQRMSKESFEKALYDFILTPAKAQE